MKKFLNLSYFFIFAWQYRRYSFQRIRDKKVWHKFIISIADPIEYLISQLTYNSLASVIFNGEKPKRFTFGAWRRINLNQRLWKWPVMYLLFGVHLLWFSFYFFFLNLFKDILFLFIIRRKQKSIFIFWKIILSIVIVKYRRVLRETKVYPFNIRNDFIDRSYNRRFYRIDDGI